MAEAKITSLPAICAVDLSIIFSRDVSKYSCFACVYFPGSYEDGTEYFYLSVTWNS